MERKFKFRAWWPHVKVMAYFGKECIVTSNGTSEYGVMFTSTDATYMGKYQLMQSTELFDKDGKEIYEGDIIQMADDEQVSCIITWMDGSFHMITDPSAGSSPILAQRLKRFKVIGNIYENPELFKIKVWHD